MESTVRQNTALSRFELDVGGALAFANYRLADGVVTFLHTETPPALRGQGVACPLDAFAERGGLRSRHPEAVDHDHGSSVASARG